MTGNRDENLSEHAPEVRVADEPVNDGLPDVRPVDYQTDAPLVTVTEQPLLTATIMNASSGGFRDDDEAHLWEMPNVVSYQVTVQQVGDTWVGRWEAGNGNTEADTLEECLRGMAEVITLIQEGE